MTLAPETLRPADLHAALTKIGLPVAAAEVSSGQLGPTTTAALEHVQKQAGLPITGEISADTVGAIKAELTHVFYADSKKRTSEVQDMLARVGHPVDATEAKARQFGDSTRQSLATFAESVGLQLDNGRITDDLVEKLQAAALAARFSTKTQVAGLQRVLGRVNRIAKLDAPIDAGELRKRELGATSQATIRAFQQKYKLPVTGTIDPATYGKIVSVANSRPRPPALLAVRSTEGITPIGKTLRLNMKSEQVGGMQRALAFLGYKIDQKEFDTRTFGGTTRAAVLEYQRSKGLPLTGHLEGATRERLNADLQRVLPPAPPAKAAYRIRGSVRDALWQGKAGVRVQVWETALRGDGTLLGERKTLQNGFFDIPYDAPRNPKDGSIKQPFQVQVRVLDANGNQAAAKVKLAPTQVAWINFTDGDQPYRGTSEYEQVLGAVTPYLSGVAITDLKETDNEKDITYISLHSGLDAEEVMGLVLAHLVSAEYADPALTPDAVYAFIGQNYPPGLPSDLVGSTVGWTQIDALVERAAEGVVFMEADAQAQVLEQAVPANVVPIATIAKSQQILDALAAKRQTFALSKPILVGNGTLESLLAATPDVPAASYPEVATAFLAHRGMGTPFWDDLRARADTFGGAQAVADLRDTVQLGAITKHDEPTFTFLKAQIANPANATLKAVADTAKLDHDGWKALIAENGGHVPAGLPGTPDQQADAYATTLAQQAERLFPTIALAAHASRSNDNALNNLAGVQQVLDSHPDLDLAQTSVAEFVKNNGNLVLDPDVVSEMKVLQRVQRIALDAATGSAMLDQKLHHSAQIVFLGQERLAQTLAPAVDRATALTVFGKAELQYAQVLAALGEFRFELHRADPVAIIDHTYTPDEQAQLAGNIPDLEALFGAFDFCDCSTCQSLYGPAAYLADVLRFIDSHLSQQPPKTVREVLFDRRPDIGNIKLNCQNTETPLPYVDLVCEILEAAVPAPNAQPDLTFQTTRSAEELRAFPENVRQEVYDLLRTADFPLDRVFDLWQQEARVWLNHLGVPRWQLMEWLQARPQGAAPSPTDTSIAGEYFGLSSHETTLVTTADATAARQQALWGFDCTQAEIGVEDFLAHSKLAYEDLLQLMQVQWVNAAGVPGDLAIDRPAASCALSDQKVTNLTLDRFDRIHRFLRLWRASGWTMWEVDRLVRADRIGNGTLDAAALATLWRARQVHQKLGISVDDLLAFYGALNTETRTQPDDPTQTIASYYDALFQNQRVTDPVDPQLALAQLAGTLADHKQAIATALGISDADFDRLVARPNPADATLGNLSWMYATVTLARTTSLTIERLLRLEDLCGIADVFATPKDTLDFLELRTWVAHSGFDLDELDYVLNDRPDSPYGLRDEAVAQLVERMRTSRYAATADTEQGAIVTEVASAFALTPAQTLPLLQRLSIGAKTLLDVLKDPALVERSVDANGVEGFKNPATAAAFPDVFAAYHLLRKVSLVLTRQKLTDADDLGWLLDEHATFGLLDLVALPVQGAPAAPLFESWLALTKWLDLRARYPQPENATLRGVFDAAAALDAGVRGTLATLTQWPADAVDELHAALQLSYTAADNEYVTPETYLRLERAVKAVKRLSVSATTAASWCDRDTDATQSTIAQQTRAAAKAKYDTPTWLAKAAPLYDVVREQKRDSLISYLIEYEQRNEPPSVVVNGNQYANPQWWRDADDMLRYFLIDVEMGPLQQTSRIKQAISSLQMFVQRCFLNLEQPYVQVGEQEKADTVSLNSWRQWEYMKSYAVWAAARKVFLYPENWILPELRDDKTPFFKELEAELQQGDLTDEHAETALRHYLEKVHEVSRLSVLAAYHEIDDDHPDDNLSPTVNLLHVVARTKTDPALYYYRRFDLNYNTWSPWERIDVDIAGDHLLPVVYNRKLYLFWLVIVEKPQKTKKQPKTDKSPSTDAPEAPKQLEIQLAWSVSTDDGWASRKVSREKLIHPWERPSESYHLKSRYKSRENLLWLDVYLSTSQEFNETKFWDPFKNDREYLSAFHTYDETARPWHSSSFVFDGGIVAVKMKPLKGWYHLVDVTGAPSDNTTYSTSFDYVQGAFGAASRPLLPLQGKYEIAPRLPLPDGMHYHFNRLANNVRKPNPNKLNVLELANTRTVVQGAQSPFELVFSQDQIRFDTAQWGAEPILYQDLQRAFFVRSQWQPVTVGYNQVVQRLAYDFYPFDQPYSALFLRELDRSGVDGVLTRRIQRFPASYFPGDTFTFSGTYAPIAPSAADATAETDIVDFSLSGAYSVYNWESFFHVPLLVATKLSQNQRFEEAMKWFHYIFDPTNVDEISSPQRFWVTRPFFETNSDEYRKERIENILTNLGVNLDQVRAWRNDPFNPHKIARYRPVAYQKTVVMKYLNNLMAWGDQLFAQDTLESINQATLLYSLAHELLGRRPEKVPAPPRPDYSYAELLAHGELDPLGNESVAAQIENLTPPAQNASRNGGEPLPLLDPLYFRIPANDQLLQYWDTVADRLFKIRHSMNIKGVVRQLPLFEPPLDPALLVKAAAAGIDIGSLDFGLQPAQGPYRYRSLVTSAVEFTNEVKSLGDKLLAALEKRDAEGLALLRSTNEIALLQASKAVRQKQIEEATDSIAALEQSLASAQAKSDYYGSRDFINVWEGTALALSGGSALAQAGIAVGYIAAGGLKLIPDFVVGASGFGGSPHATAKVTGGDKIGDVAEAAVKTLSAIAAGLDKFASLASTMGSYTRRKEEWDFQKGLADIDIQQINQQIAAATVRQAIAQQEADNLDLQIEQSQAADEYMHSKYTNQELYDWMVGQISTVYFQAYKLAFDMARSAEAALQFELGRPDLSFIQFGYWDSLKKGLLSAEKLSIDLRRMQSAYLQTNSRELELTKHISLAQFMPLSLVALRSSGECTIELPEWLYDMDFPGHYKRRIKSVAITVPAVVGPYGGVHATVSLTKNGIRVNSSQNGTYGDPLNPGGDSRFAANPVPVSSIATSTGQNDSGVFELSFNDERYLPFEGAGAVSQWTITMPPSANAFDFSTISDVILHVRYTALDGGPLLAAEATQNLTALLPTSGFRLLALKNEFGDDWYRFLNPTADTDQTLTLTLKPEHFPFYTHGKTIDVTAVDLFLESPAGDSFDVKLAVPGEALPANADPAAPDAAYGNVPHYARQIAVPSVATGDWTIQVKTHAAADFRSLATADLSNAYLVVHFKTA
jgi:peptidoglycan hydrolase-like protein with peptidoglycan-binding domain